MGHQTNANIHIQINTHTIKDFNPHWPCTPRVNNTIFTPLPYPDTDGTEDDCLPCTPDELASLVREIQDSPLVKTHTYHLKGYKNTFVGRELVTWLVENKGYSGETVWS